MIHFSYAVLFVPFVYQVAVALSEMPVLLTRSVNDDTFYYLQVAWNVGHGNGFTFDGINPTNGVQPLWALILSGIAPLALNKITFLRSTLIVAALANLVAGILLVYMGKDRIPGWALLFMALIWSSFQLKTNVVQSGLEISINLLFFTAVIAFLSTNIWTNPKKSYQNLLFLGLLACFLVLARLDTVIYLPGIWLIGMMRAFGSSLTHQPFQWAAFLKGSVLFSLLPLFLIGPYLLWNQINFGSILPISGQFKSFYTDRSIQSIGGRGSIGYWLWLIPLWVQTAINILDIAFSRVFLIDSFYLLNPITQMQLRIAALVAPLLSVSSYVIMRLWTRNHQKEPSFQAILRLLILTVSNFFIIWVVLTHPIQFLQPLPMKILAILALLIANVLIVATMATVKLPNAKILKKPSATFVMVGLGSVLLHLTVVIINLTGFLDYGRWYFITQYVTLFIITALLLKTLHFRPKIPWGTHMVALLFLSIGAISLVGSIAVRANHFDNYDPQTQYIARYHSAIWIFENLPNDAVLGSYNAGQLGYFSNRPVINLDGLVNNQELLYYYREGIPITVYLDSKNVTHIADYPTEYDSDDQLFKRIPRDRLTFIKEFPVTEHGDLMIFYYR